MFPASASMGGWHYIYSRPAGRASAHLKGVKELELLHILLSACSMRSQCGRGQVHICNEHVVKIRSKTWESLCDLALQPGRLWDQGCLEVCQAEPQKSDVLLHNEQEMRSVLRRRR